MTLEKKLSDYILDAQYDWNSVEFNFYYNIERNHTVLVIDSINWDAPLVRTYSGDISKAEKRRIYEAWVITLMHLPAHTLHYWD